MPQHRVTLTFRSDTGHEYLYDDVTGCIFPWNELREILLDLHISSGYEEKRQLLATQYGASDVHAAYRFISHWRQNYGAFVRTWSESDWVPAPPAAQLEERVRNGSLELVLVLTENCNLRCRYCSLSKTYPLNRVRTARRMSMDTARRAVDWYVRLVQPQIARSPRKRFGLSLYGGEPMANMRVLRGILEYSRDRYPDTFIPVMTTNGTLLTPKNVETLVEHDVMLAVSIDGPEKEHDRLRVDARDRGSFARVVENLRRIKEDHPQYWATRIASVSVYDWGTDVEAVEKFFDDMAGDIPRSIFVNQVGSHNSAWYGRYANEDRERMMGAIARLRDRYKAAKVERRSTSHYMNCLIGMGISMVLLRRRVRDDRPYFVPFGGSCMPGDKLAVHVDGKIDMCERVNGTYPIGHLGADGIDYERVKQIINTYREQVLYACPSCPATKHCSVCYAHVEGDNAFAKMPQLCVGTVASAKEAMADFVSILEANPRADFKLETETARLEKRLLFF